MNQPRSSSDIDKKATKERVEAALEQYRLFKFTSFQRRQVSMTASYSNMPRSDTGVTSDQTGSIAAYNIDEPERRRLYCLEVEAAVEELPEKERDLIKRRYFDRESRYIMDFTIYNDMEISAPTYDKLRWRAFEHLALYLGIEVYDEN
ncbi:ArpU family phage packaging/lysis transcriptional regulator [Paenibacillus sp. RUD330]|uniref:ArpU family phage packaging/lysis transcriptional regulator n=1 Tax=Paenibacillus sp. RUD330 TaxID=2023772 RepID=UPI000B928514|nr:ArpU family phage packaging/lysis transcriptional regulator [Paenibacillus sp. RUD330]ASS66513.1 transcriptional regulator [Paenibacillus sp. RUD330]